MRRRRFIKSVANDRPWERPSLSIQDRKVKRITDATRSADLAAIPGPFMLWYIAMYLHVLWTRTGYIKPTILPLRWIYPHDHFTRKGPGRRHVDGPDCRAKLIHKSLTKQIHRNTDYDTGTG